MNITIDTLIARLHDEGCSCVIASGGDITLCHSRGVKDLLMILKENPEKLSGAMIADKVVGKGAAALMVLGGVRQVYADVVSVPALAMFADAGITVGFGECVDGIVNRSRTGSCPVESLCRDVPTAAGCLPLIEHFVNNMK